MKYYYLNKHEINNLRTQLMSKIKQNKSYANREPHYSNNTICSKKEIASEFFKFRNSEIGIDLEENVRQTLIYKYNWKESSMPRSFCFREISVKNKNKIIKTGETIEFKIKNKTVKFRLNKDESLDLIEGKEVTNINDKSEITIDKYKKKIDIKCFTKVEIDGIFQITNFSPSIFDENEISVIYKNIDDNQMKNFEQAVVEIKLSKNKFQEMVNQLYRDKQIFKKFTKENFLFIGFMNSKSVEEEEIIDAMDKLNELNCVIFGIKNSIFGNRNVTKHIDWLKIYEDEKKFTNFDKRLKNIEEKIDQIMDILAKLGNQNKNDNNNKMKKFLGKKRK